MTEQEKAEEIWDQMKGFRISHNHRRKCCLVCVDQILKALEPEMAVGMRNFYQKVRTYLEHKGK